jgi:phospholipase C
MSKRQWLKAGAGTAGLLAMLQFTLVPIVRADDFVVIGPPSSNAVIANMRSLPFERPLPHDQKLAFLRRDIKYVFILFQENRSFDHYFGTFPGVVGLFSQPPSETTGFTQQIVNTDGSVGTISPFLIPQTVTNTSGQVVALHPEDTDSSDHSHLGIVNDLDVTGNVAANDRYALDEEGLTTKDGVIVSTTTGLPPTSPPSLAKKQKGELAMGHLDCNTVPFLWQYADRFTLFDNFRMTVVGPSAPNAIALIAGQTGETQWALHPTESASEPITADVSPFPGSNADTATVKPPFGPNDVSPATPTLNQTYASLPLSFMGYEINSIIASDEHPVADLLDVQDDIEVIAHQGAVHWAWYQEGFDHEPTDGTGPATHDNYITHHEGPQYFGYLGDNTQVLGSNLKGLGDFFSDIAAGKLPAQGGVFYIRGGYGNNDGLVPVDPDATVQANFTGNDDHPGYSDAQISEALLADEVNAIAASPYWANSVIIITYDETDGIYDHVQPAFRVNDPSGNVLEAGPRIPAIVISPYSLAHGVSHVYSEHGSVIKFIDELFNLTPLATLPDEVKGQQLGQAELGQSSLTASDGPNNGIGDLFEAFDDDRLQGWAPPLPPFYAEIPETVVKSLPHYNEAGCEVLHIVPTDIVHGKTIDPAPADFNPRPSSTPGNPTSPGWNG